MEMVGHHDMHANADELEALRQGDPLCLNDGPKGGERDAVIDDPPEDPAPLSRHDGDEIEAR